MKELEKIKLMSVTANNNNHHQVYYNNTINHGINNQMYLNNSNDCYSHPYTYPYPYIQSNYNNTITTNNIDNTSNYIKSNIGNTIMRINNNQQSDMRIYILFKFLDLKNLLKPTFEDFINVCGADMVYIFPYPSLRNVTRLGRIYY